jgi:hypothetical protein
MVTLTKGCQLIDPALLVPADDLLNNLTATSYEPARVAYY